MTRYPVMLSLMAGLSVTVTSQKPSVCGRYDCPAFTDDSSNPGFLVRTMTANSDWVGTTQVGSSSGMFMKLFGYISGDNQRNEKIDMTVPVLNKHVTNPSTRRTSETMSFYIAVPNPPSPTNAEVSLDSIPANSNFYVMRFVTYWWRRPSSSDWNDKVEELKGYVSRAGLNTEPNVHYEVGYSSPWSFKKTHEVWLVPA